MTDSSFKLFAAEPTPGHDPKKLIAPSKSTNDLSNTPARDFFTDADEEGRERRHHHHSVNAQKDEARADSSQPAAEQRKSTDVAPERKEVIRGPWRILRLLPRESRHIIGRMLEIKPKERVKMPEILDEPWIANTVICQQTGPGTVVNAEDHSHVLEPPASSTPTPSQR
jgi:serine/threonine protein kinase